MSEELFSFLMMVLIINALFLILIIRQYRFVLCVKNGIKTTGVIANSKNNYLVRGVYGKRSAQVSHLEVVYEYEGKKYQSKLPCMNYNTMKEGDQIEIFVNPKNPKLIGHPSQGDQIIIFLFMEILFDIMCAYIWFQ